MESVSRVDKDRRSVVCGQNVTNIVYCEDGSSVHRVESIPCGLESTEASAKTETLADLVIAAAGCGISASFLGGVPLLERPGCIEYGRLRLRQDEVQDDPRRVISLRRILLDDLSFG